MKNKRRLIKTVHHMSFAQMEHIFLKFWFAAIVATVLIVLALVLPIAIIGMAFEVVFSS